MLGDKLLQLVPLLDEDGAQALRGSDPVPVSVADLECLEDFWPPPTRR